MFQVTSDTLAIPLSILLLPVNIQGKLDDLPLYKQLAIRYPTVVSTYKEACTHGWFGICTTLLLETSDSNLPYILVYGSSGDSNTRWTSILAILEPVLNKLVGICSAIDPLHDIGVVVSPTTIQEGEKVHALITDFMYGLSRQRTVYLYLQGLH